MESSIDWYVSNYINTDVSLGIISDIEKLKKYPSMKIIDHSTEKGADLILASSFALLSLLYCKVYNQTLSLIRSEKLKFKSRVLLDGCV